MDTPAPRRGRPKTTGTTPGRNIRVPDDEWAAWQAVANRANTTVSLIVREAMRRELSRRKKSRKKLPES